MAQQFGLGGNALVRQRQGDLRLLRRFHDLGVRYMTLTHVRTIGWADSATDAPRRPAMASICRATTAHE